MKDFEQLMSVWQQQPAKEQRSAEELLRLIKRGVRTLQSQLYWGIVAVSAVMLLTFLITFFLPFRWTTYIGLFIMLLTMLMYAALSIRNYRLLSQRDPTNNPAAYLSDLKQYQRNRTKITGWFYYLYVLLISLGLSLYLIEVLQKTSFAFQLSIYGFDALWIFFLTFFYKKRIFKNEEEKLNLIIERLERLEGQFSP